MKFFKKLKIKQKNVFKQTNECYKNTIHSIDINNKNLKN